VCGFIQENKSITHLNLDGNEIGHDGAKALAKMLEVGSVCVCVGVADC